ncbi:exopolysaccharide biosynthesis protein [Aestuariivirga sp. YIM B02566]|uniref:Exopolysaccharide biosynthesis protein n=1 Tax=Taklimakanibacter albus TaxID=2800327 RepID=A0ACC5R0T9_9HYPH|nr:exopolysaccharide biosynthesis protein [Aestuariivirga sp. YIM B02566]
MTEPHNERLSDILKRLAQDHNPDLTLGDVVRALGERGFGALILLLAAPNIIPLPPGSSFIFGVPLVFITAQLMIKQDKVWLPQKLMNAKVGGGRLPYLLNRLVPYVVKVERLLKPRGTLLTSSLGERLAGLAGLFCAIILLLPIPGANMAPALALCCFALGLIEQDDLAMAGGWFGTAATVVILILLYLFGTAIFAFLSNWLAP